MRIADGRLPARSPTEAGLHDAFRSLATEVQRAHEAPLTAVGTMDVAHGSHWIAPALIRLMKLPPAGLAQPVRLVVTASGREQQWRREFRQAVLLTRQRAEGSTILERNGLGTIIFHAEADGGALIYRQASMWVTGIPIPAWIAPNVTSRVSPEPGGWHVDVCVTWRSHCICRYSGSMAAA